MAIKKIIQINALIINNLNVNKIQHKYKYSSEETQNINSAHTDDGIKHGILTFLDISNFYNI